MTLSFCSFSSSSSGNCYLIKSNTTALLVDAGISGKKILEGLAATNTLPENINGILITHEHIDHVKSLRTISKKLPFAKTYANIGTWSQLIGMIPAEKQVTFFTGEEFVIGDIHVMPFPISHDATEPVGFSFICRDKQISIMTDTGCVTEESFSSVMNADLLVLEANHDEQVLKMGRYPWLVKQRILSDVGHLSNTAAANCLCRILKECKSKKDRTVLLAHLSSENNFPEMAYQTVKNILEESGHMVDSCFQLQIMLKNTLSKIYKI